MLDTLRKNSKHWMVTAIIAVVIVGLAFFFGYSSREAARGISWAAKIDGETIKMGEFLNRYRAVVENYRAKLGPNFDEKMLDSMNVRPYILKGIVEEKIASKEAIANGLGVSDDELRDNIRNYPAFQKNGAFSMEYYKNLLSYNRVKPSEFERLQREEMLRQKLKMLVYTSAKASDDEVMTAYRTEAEKATLAFISVNTSDASSNVSAEEVKRFLSTASGKKETMDYYTVHNDDFKVPAQPGKPAVIKMYNDVKEDLARNLLRKKKEQDFSATKVDNAVQAGSIDAAAKVLGQKVQYTTSFSRKEQSIPSMSSTNLNDVIWAFGLNKGKIYKRETNGRTYIVAVKDRTFKPLDVQKFLPLVPFLYL